MNTENKINKDNVADICQDLIFISFIYSIQRKMKEPYYQELYGYIGVMALNIVLHELIQSKIIDPDLVSEEARSVLRSIRSRYLKEIPMEDSKVISKILNEMGTDFEHYVFDMVLSVDRNKNDRLLAINFSFWDLENYIKDHGDIVHILSELPMQLLEAFSQIFMGSEELVTFVEEASSRSAEVIESSIKLEKKSYASGVFFKNPEPIKQDKVLILYHYTIFSLLELMDELIPNIQIPVGNYLLDTDIAKMKLKALFIEVFGVNMKRMETPVVSEIKKLLNNEIKDASFFPLNRKLRNNIHYGRIDKITQEEYKLIGITQTIYIQQVMKVFRKKTKYKLGNWYQFIKWIANNTDANMIEEKKRKDGLE
ncbi:hypothetical protein M2150_001791 [Lachnospiraceae bacterium PM6-15]|uniref:hypothetical protein n=1 Tax=Ohessyouella blattaphilus TaxID=2949333 RepID=UPI003E227048